MTIDTVPALALKVLRAQLQDEHAAALTELRIQLAADQLAVKRELGGRLGAAIRRADAAQRQFRKADDEITQAAARADVAVRAERQRIVEQLRTEARTVARSWAGAYRYIANQIEESTA